MTKFTNPLGKSHIPDEGFEIKMKNSIKEKILIGIVIYLLWKLLNQKLHSLKIY